MIHAADVGIHCDEYAQFERPTAFLTCRKGFATVQSWRLPSDDVAEELYGLLSAIFHDSPEVLCILYKPENRTVLIGWKIKPDRVSKSAVATQIEKSVGLFKNMQTASNKAKRWSEANLAGHGYDFDFTSCFTLRNPTVITDPDNITPKP